MNRNASSQLAISEFDKFRSSATTLTSSKSKHSITDNPSSESIKQIYNGFESRTFASKFQVTLNYRSKNNSNSSFTELSSDIGRLDRLVPTGESEHHLKTVHPPPNAHRNRSTSRRDLLIPRRRREVHSERSRRPGIRYRPEIREELVPNLSESRRAFDRHEFSAQSIKALL